MTSGDSADEHAADAGHEKDPAAARGADGLTPEELQRGRAEWWDDAFTALLLDAIPKGDIQLVEVGCGLGHAPRALLPALPAARYVGVDVDAERVEACRRSVSDWSDRASAVQGTAEALPFDSESVDVVLTVMTLEHIKDVPLALNEVRRVLRPGGRLVAVEPDNSSQLLRFDGPLPGLDEVFQTLFATLQARHRSADLSLGPCLPSLIRAAGFHDVQARVHALQSMHDETGDAFVDRLDWVVGVIAESGNLPDDEPALAACRRRLGDLRTELAGRVGFSAHVVPAWRCIGTKPLNTGRTKDPGSNRE